MSKLLALVLIALLVGSASVTTTAFAQAPSSKQAVAESAPPGPASPQMTRLTATEIEKLVTGKTLLSVGSKGLEYEVKLKPGGKLQGETSSTDVHSPGRIYDGGMWSVEKDTLCITYDTWQRGRKICWIVRKDEAGSYWWHSSAKRPLVSVVVK